MTSSSASPRWRGLVRLAPAALVALAAIWQIGAVACAGGRVPADDDWARAAAHVRGALGDDELIVFAPAWLDPVGRLHLGDQIPVAMAARMDAARYAAIWELSARGARAAETRDLAPVSEHRFGRLRVRRYEQEPAEVVTDFVDALSSAELAGRWSQRPRVVLEEVGFTPRRCILALPRAGEAVRVAFDDVALGETLVGHAGLADIFTLRDNREPGALRVLIDGAEVTEVALGIDDGWVRFEAKTAPRAGARVEFVATAEAPDRRICFAAEARR